MNLLISYLNEKFQVPNFEELKEHFSQEFGVDVKLDVLNGETLYLFKYNLITAIWSKELTRLCRGTIVHHNGSEWTIVSLCWNKFFNQAEGHSGVHTNSLFKEFLKKNPYFQQKADGSAVQVYNFKGKWKASTLGTINTTKINDLPFTFEELFWQTLNKDTSLFNGYEDYTILFELCTPYNRILTKYPEPCIFLLSIRSKNGHYLGKNELSKLASILNVKVPYEYSLNELGIDSIEKANEFVEKESKNTIYGEHPEGFVAYVDGVPIAKFKNQQYCIMHKFGGGDRGQTMNLVIESFFNGSLDDVTKYLEPFMLEYSMRLRNWYISISNSIISNSNELSKISYSNQKEYALKVLSLDKIHSSFYFMNKEKILTKNCAQDEVNSYFRKVWSNFEKEIKKL